MLHLTRCTDKCMLCSDLHQPWTEFREVKQDQDDLWTMFVGTIACMFEGERSRRTRDQVLQAATYRVHRDGGYILCNE